MPAPNEPATARPAIESTLNLVMFCTSFTAVTATQANQRRAGWFQSSARFLDRSFCVARAHGWDQPGFVGVRQAVTGSTAQSATPQSPKPRQPSISVQLHNIVGWHSFHLVKSANRRAGQVCPDRSDGLSSSSIGPAANEGKITPARPTNSAPRQEPHCKLPFFPEPLEA